MHSRPPDRAEGRSGRSIGSSTLLGSREVPPQLRRSLVLVERGEWRSRHAGERRIEMIGEAGAFVAGEAQRDSIDEARLAQGRHGSHQQLASRVLRAACQPWAEGPEMSDELMDELEAFDLVPVVGRRWRDRGFGDECAQDEPEGPNVSMETSVDRLAGSRGTLIFGRTHESIELFGGFFERPTDDANAVSHSFGREDVAGLTAGVRKRLFEGSARFGVYVGGEGFHGLSEPLELP